MSLYDRASAAMRETLARARAGLPEPGDYTCSWCGGPATVYVDDLPPDVSPATARWLCPCCSPPGCPHRYPDCAVCGLATAPMGTFATGGPFVRCDGPGAHPSPEDRA